MAQYQQQASKDQPPQQQGAPLSRQVVKATTAVTMAGSLAVLSGLTLVATVIGLVLITPLLVIFSPVLVPAAITLFLITAGFVTSAGLTATSSFVWYWMHQYVTGKKPIGADLLDNIKERISCAVRDMKDKAQNVGHQTQQQIKGTQQQIKGTQQQIKGTYDS